MTLLLAHSVFLLAVRFDFLEGVHQTPHGDLDAPNSFVVPMPHDLSLVRDRRLPS